MKNCLIMGSGRSGTSLLGGTLHQAGYFMGDKLYLPRESNPKGFFEWKEINQINEQILSRYGSGPVSLVLKRLLRKNTVRNPGKNQRWLLSLSPKVTVTCSDATIEKRIEKVIEKEPFCYKDPRFSYTLPVWRRFLKPDTAFICVFREPTAAVASILRECKSRSYLADLYINQRMAYGVWTNIYSHILLNRVEKSDSFFFAHYDQIYEGAALPSLSDFLGAELKSDFVDRDLKRLVSKESIPSRAKEVYKILCHLANYRPV